MNEEDLMDPNSGMTEEERLAIQSRLEASKAN